MKRKNASVQMLGAMAQSAVPARVHQHRQHQRARAADAIREPAEHDAADGPADQQQGGQPSRPFERDGLRGSACRSGCPAASARSWARRN